MSELSPSPSPPAVAPPPPPAEVWRRFLEEPLSPDPPPVLVEPTERRTLEPGTLLGDWEILRFLARGGMGEVFAAFYRPSHCRFALKVLGGDHHDDPDALTRFHYEYWALTRVKHEAIVAPFCAGKDEGLRWYAMELLEGESLDRVVERELLSPLRACRIGVRIADALTVVHATNIVHRDLKPGNIFLLKGTEDRVKLLDLGIAKLLPEFFADAEMRPRVEERLQTLPGVPIGTAGYMAPEVILGAKAAPAQDIYGLAATLFRLTVGRSPYATLLAPDPGDEPRWSEALGRPLPRAFELVLRKALAVDPSCRQASMSEFRDQLQLVVEELEAEAAEEEGRGDGGAAERARGDAAPTVIETGASMAIEVEGAAADLARAVRREAIVIEPVARPSDADDLPAPIASAEADLPGSLAPDLGWRERGSSGPPRGDGRADDRVDAPGGILAVPEPPRAERSRRALVVVAFVCVVVGEIVGFALGRVSNGADAWVARWARGVDAAVRHLPLREAHVATTPAPPLDREDAPREDAALAVAALEDGVPSGDPAASKDAASEDADPSADQAASKDVAAEDAVASGDQAAPTKPTDAPRRLGRAAFRKVVLAHASALDPCIRVLPEGTEAAAEVRVRPDGSVERVSLVPEVSFIALRCVDKALGGLRFPQADAPSTHTWPLRRP